ncbi:MAG: 2OG-Fe(II) oxygenase [Saprospiraceae bacterium]|nr:2OG-Fe(II) oxygenase [Saprospiraceae bacterium]
MSSSGIPILDQLVDDLTENSFAIVDDFLSPVEVSSLSQLLADQFDAGDFKLAGIGNMQNFNVDKQIRNDHISWLDPESTDPGIVNLFHKIDGVVSYLNRTCFLALSEYEFHFARYQPGSFFKRHLDAFKTDDSRKISMVMYLNENWKAEEGGAIHLYVPGPDGTETTKVVYPIAGRLVCFRSDILEHEVIPATRARMSITGWLKTRPVMPF